MALKIFIFLEGGQKKRTLSDPHISSGNKALIPFFVIGKEFLQSDICQGVV